MCIPPSKRQRNTTQRQTLMGRSTQVSLNLMETPVLVLGRGCADLIRMTPWRGLDSGSVSCCCFLARIATYSTRFCEEVSTTEEWEDESRQALSLSARIKKKDKKYTTKKLSK